MHKYSYFVVVVLCFVALALAKTPDHALVDEFDSTTEVSDPFDNLTTNGTTGEEKPRYHLFHIDFQRVATPMIIIMWLFLACICKIAFHMAPKLSSMLPESVMIIVLGLIIGGLLVYANPNRETQVSPLTADIFFLYLLPPIILDAGYFMPNRLFFDHIGTILSFAVVGTIWNTLTIGISLYAVSITGIFGDPSNFEPLHILLFSSLICAVDPVAVLAVFEEIHVEEVLFILVFGESLLNDGVSVVLYHIFEGFIEIGMVPGNKVMPMDIMKGLLSFFFVAIGGTLIGVLWGFFAAFITRFTYQVRVIEPMFIFLMSYLSYLNAELFHFSGILAITFCGITMKNYTEQNISQKSSTTTKYAMKMIASSSETVIFLFLGVATVHGTEHSFNGWFIFFTILFCSVYRILGVLILSTVCNRFRVQKIDFVQKFVMSYGGLRGAVAFALAITIDPGMIKLAPTFVTTTIAMVFFTVFVQGITIKPLVAKLGVKKSSKRKLKMNERLHEKTMDYIMAGVEDIIGKHGKHYLRGWFKRVNNKHLQPRLVRNQHANEPKLLETLSNLKMQDAMNQMRDRPMTDLESLTQLIMSKTYAKNSIREWNLDVGEIEYKPNDRDAIESRFHHIISESTGANNQRRQSTYKRHAVHDSDMASPPSEFELKMALTARQNMMTSIRNRKNRKLAGHSSSSMKRPIVANGNGSAVRLQNDYLQESALANGGFLDDEGLVMTEDSSGRPKIEIITNKPRRLSTRAPTAAETMFPWKRFADFESPTKNSDVRRASVIPHDDVQDSPQALAEVVLPWKRNEDDWSYEPHQQQHFPAWLTRTEHLDHYSPTNKVLGKIDESHNRPAVQEIFEDIIPTQGSSKDKLAPQEMPTLRNSAKDNIYRRRSSLRDDPSLRMGTMEEYFDPTNTNNKMRPFAPLRNNGLPHRHHSHDPRLHPRRSSDSLLRTVIVEEDSAKGRKPDDKSPPHPVNMNPNGDHTRF